MNTITQIIYDQLGGRRFAVITGSKDFFSTSDTLRMSLARNKSGANRLDIRYDEGSDTYTMRFYRLTFHRKECKVKCKEIAECSDVYCDSLQHVFIEVTGLYTRL